MNDWEIGLSTCRGDGCEAVEAGKDVCDGGAPPDAVAIELQTVYAALGMGDGSCSVNATEFAANLWDLLGENEKARALRASHPTDRAQLDAAKRIAGTGEPLWLVIAQNAMAGRKIAGTTTETKPSTATVDSVTETIRRMVRESVKVATIDPLAVIGRQVIPIPPATFTRGPGGEPMLTLTVHKSRSVPLEVADINRAEGEPAADSADLLTRTLEHEAVASGAAESEPEPAEASPVAAATEAVLRFGQAVAGVDRGRALGFWYTNHRGLRAWRWVIPGSFGTGESSYYPDVVRGLFLNAFDLDRNADRSFLVERMEGPFQTAEPLDLPVGPNVDQQERFAELRAEGHTEHCASAQVAAGQECGCAPEVKWVPVTKKHTDVVFEEWVRQLTPEPAPVRDRLVGAVRVSPDGQALSVDPSRVEFREARPSEVLAHLLDDEDATREEHAEVLKTMGHDLAAIEGRLNAQIDRLMTGNDALDRALSGGIRSPAGFVIADSEAEEMLTLNIMSQLPSVKCLRSNQVDAASKVLLSGGSVIIDMTGHTVGTGEGIAQGLIRDAMMGSGFLIFMGGIHAQWLNRLCAQTVLFERWPDTYTVLKNRYQSAPTAQPIFQQPDGQGGTVTPTDAYAEHLALIESWRVADPPPTVPSGEVLSVEPEAVQAAVPVAGVTRSATLIHTHDPEGKRDPRVNPWVGDRWAARVGSDEFQIVTVYEHESGISFDALWLKTNERMDGVSVSILDDRHYIGHFPPVSDVPPSTFRPAGLLPEGW